MKRNETGKKVGKLTIDHVRSYERDSNLSDEEALEVIRSVEKLASLLLEHCLKKQLTQHGSMGSNSEIRERKN